MIQESEEVFDNFWTATLLGAFLIYNFKKINKKYTFMSHRVGVNDE